MSEKIKTGMRNPDKSNFTLQPCCCPNLVKIRLLEKMSFYAHFGKIFPLHFVKVEPRSVPAAPEAAAQ